MLYAHIFGQGANVLARTHQQVEHEEQLFLYLLTPIHVVDHADQYFVFDQFLNAVFVQVAQVLEEVDDVEVKLVIVVFIFQLLNGELEDLVVAEEPKEFLASFFFFDIGCQ